MVYKLKNETVEDSLTRTVKQLSTFNSEAILLYVGEFYQRKLLSEVGARVFYQHIGGLDAAANAVANATYIVALATEAASGIVTKLRQDFTKT